MGIIEPRSNSKGKAEGVGIEERRIVLVRQNF